MPRFFVEGGFTMWPILAFGLLQLALGVAFALDPKRRVMTPFAVLGGVTFLCGLVGLAFGAIATFVYVEKVPAGRQYAVTMAGLAESLQNVSLALVLIVLSTLVLAVGTLRAARAAGPEPKA